MKVVLISGKAESGKDTFAKFFKMKAELDDRKVLVIKYGDILKFVAKEYCGWSGLKDEEGRHLLQYIGTDVARKNNENVWVNCIKEIVCAFQDIYDYVLIPDTRFPNEITEWLGSGFDYVTVRINRKNEDDTDYENALTEEQRKHPSEIALDKWIFDYYVISGNIDRLRKRAFDIYEELEGF